MPIVTCSRCRQQCLVVTEGRFPRNHSCPNCGVLLSGSTNVAPSFGGSHPGTATGQIPGAPEASRQLSTTSPEVTHG